MGYASTIESEWQLMLDNYRLYTPDASSAVCPVCLRSMSLDGVAEIKATKGHLSPAFFTGPRSFVVECQDCNNTFGRKFESKLAKLVRAERFRALEIGVSE